MTADHIIHVNRLRFILNREMRTHTPTNPIRFEQISHFKIRYPVYSDGGGREVSKTIKTGGKTLKTVHPLLLSILSEPN